MSVQKKVHGSSSVTVLSLTTGDRHLRRSPGVLPTLEGHSGVGGDPESKRRRDTRTTWSSHQKWTLLIFYIWLRVRTGISKTKITRPGRVRSGKTFSRGPQRLHGDLVSGGPHLQRISHSIRWGNGQKVFVPVSPVLRRCLCGSFSPCNG